MSTYFVTCRAGECTRPERIAWNKYNNAITQIVRAGGDADTNATVAGALIGAVIFFTITNFGVWTSGMYGYTMTGLISCYTLAIPFFAYSVISTIVFSFIIEIFYKSYQLKILKHQ